MTALPALERSSLVVVPGPEELATAAREVVLASEREALRRQGTFRIALGGGSTPRRLHTLLASAPEARFANWIVGFGDERWVPAEHPDSNFRMAKETLLDPAGIPERQVHRVDTGAGTPRRAAFLYAMTLRRVLAPAPGGFPRFDMVLLGLGADGHTASLFPGSSALAAAPDQLAVATWVPTLRTWRVTLTASMINAAREVLFVVSGAGKAKALAGLFTEGAEQHFPAALIRPREGRVRFLVDEAAASAL